MQRYNPKEIEPKWQAKWAEDKIYQAVENTDKPKKYIMEYFPYPSGAAMHVGHVRNYTIGDVMVRFNRMQGYNVLHPMGWDAFGLPAENYAIKTGISPRQAIDENTAKFKHQLIQMGFGYDWSREIDSSSPEYYKWTQWFFLMLFDLGLAYRKESNQWWCPIDKTVLANEQVENGKCWRCGSDVEKKSLKQWFFKITDYADRLEKDLDKLDWSEAIKSMQRNWIGRSTGAEISFTTDKGNVTVFTTRPDTIFGATFLVLAPEHPMVQSLITDEHKQRVETYIKAAQAKSDIERQETNREKTGVFSGAYAINPATKQKIPIWIADYVLAGYGSGAIMAVPAHDERDNEFAKKFNLPILQVVAERFSHAGNEYKADKPTVPRQVICAVIKHPTEDKYLIAKPTGSDFWAPLMGGIDNGETATEAAARELLEEAGYKDIATNEARGDIIGSEFYAQHKGENRIAYVQTVYIELASLDADTITQEEQSKQEIKWATEAEVAKLCVGAGASEIFKIAHGESRPMAFEGRLINSAKFTNELTSDAREKITAWLQKEGVGIEKVNYRMRDWLISRQRYWGAPIPIVHCPQDGPVAVPRDQLPVVLPEVKDYEPSGDGRSPLANVPEFLHTTCPKCGGPAERETDTMDGFACSSWYFLRFADPHNDERPFDAAKAKFWLPVDDYIGGAEHAVMHLLYARMWTKVMFDQGLIEFDEPFTTLRNQGMILAPDGNKMSKSKGNTIEPGILIDQGYGADAIRIMELFIGPWNQSANWSVEGMGGAYRFLQRIWTLVQEHLSQQAPMATASDSLPVGPDASQADDLQRPVHRTVKKVSADLEHMGYNTAIASLMELVNELFKLKNSRPITEMAWRQPLITLLQLAAPFAPHLAEELWHQLGQTSSVHVSKWPTYDEHYLVEDTVTIVIQINGKVRGQFEAAKGQSEEQVIARAKGEPNVAAHLTADIVKTIYIQDKLLNIVVWS